MSQAGAASSGGGGGSGNVVGPGSSTTNGVATFADTTGKLLASPPSPLVSSGGIMTNPHQPAFMAYLNSTSTGVIGGSSPYTLQGLTSSFDNGSNFNVTTGIFTAPVTGIYHFDVCINVSGFGATNTDLDIALKSTGIEMDPINNINPFVMSTAGNLGLSGSVLIKMTSGDTAFISINANGSAYNVFGFTGTGLTYFSGYLVC